MNLIYKWQEDAWGQLMRRRARLPHALLLTGKPGLGKSGLARAFSKALLCGESGPDGHACGKCEACNWFSLGNHPDYRLVQPDSLAPESEEDSRKDRKKSEQIRIEQIRDLEGFLAVGTHRGGLRIILADPADTMNTVTQNALLKSLEEPPPATFFMLVTHRPQRLLPTIRSRCQLLHIAIPPASMAQAWLKEQGIDDSAGALASAGGAPLMVLNAAEWAGPHQAFLSKLQEPRFDPVALAESCNALEPGLVVNWLQRWVFDLLQLQSAGTLRYHPNLQSSMQAVARRADPVALSNLLRQLGQARALASHPLNPKLFFEDIFLQYRAMVAG